jgi:Uma2 family endonuclease
MPNSSHDDQHETNACRTPGVGEYWIVDPVAQVVEVYRLAAGGFQLAQTCAEDDTVETPLLPGFLLPVGSLFQF